MSLDDLSERRRDRQPDAEEGGDREGDERTSPRASLRRENRRLRKQYARTKRAQYRNTARGFFLVGIIAFVAGLGLPASQTVLFALSGTGIFAGLMTYYLSPDTFVPATVGERVYDTLAANAEDIVADLGLSDISVYVPVEQATTTRLYVPKQSEYELPTKEQLQTPFVVTGEEKTSGLSLRPTGESLYEEFDHAVTIDRRDDVAAAVNQLVEALVAQFELLEDAESDINTEANRATIGFVGSECGRTTRFDHPVPSFLATGISRTTGKPVTVTVDTTSGDRADTVAVFEW